MGLFRPSIRSGEPGLQTSPMKVKNEQCMSKMLENQCSFSIYALYWAMLRCTRTTLSGFIGDFCEVRWLASTWHDPWRRTYSSTPSNHRHWLDRFSSLRDWLDTANRRYWFHAVIRGRTAVTPQLEGREEILQSVLEREYQRLWERHAPKEVMDSRSKIHCANACLAVATHRALLPFLRDERQVLEAINAHMGAHVAPALRCVKRLLVYCSSATDYTSCVKKLIS